MRILVVIVCVCVSVGLISHISPLEYLFCPENAVTYSLGNKGEIIVGFSLKLLGYSNSCIVQLLFSQPFSHYEIHTCASRMPCTSGSCFGQWRCFSVVRIRPQVL